MNNYIRNIDKKYCKILQELDIVLWELRYPIILDRVSSIKLCINLRLLLISDVLISLEDLFIKDVIRAMCISLQEVYVLTYDKINTLILPVGFSCNCWWMGGKVLRDFYGICVISPSLSILKSHAQYKRDLWNQILHQFY